MTIPTGWEIIRDHNGYLNIHHAPEDGISGDLVATCFQDEEHAALITAAPELLAALELANDAITIAARLRLIPWDSAATITDSARKAIRKATTLPAPDHQPLADIERLDTIHGKAGE